MGTEGHSCRTVFPVSEGKGTGASCVCDASLSLFCTLGVVSLATRGEGNFAWRVPLILKTLFIFPFINIWQSVKVDITSSRSVLDQIREQDLMSPSPHEGFFVLVVSQVNQ